MKGNYLNALLMLAAKHSLYREDGKWYHNLKRFPGVLFDKNGYIIFHTQEDYLNHPQLQHKKDLHVINGIENLAGYRPFTMTERLLIGDIISESLIGSPSEEEKIRVSRYVESIIRKKTLAEKIKKLYKNKCQLCGTSIFICENKFYSEVHHIVPLGRPHNGPDHISNMICVCPNCHVQLDLKAIVLDTSKFKALKHYISEGYIYYHNNQVQKTIYS